MKNQSLSGTKLPTPQKDSIADITKKFENLQNFFTQRKLKYYL